MFSGMARMVAAGEPIDALTVSGHLREWDVRGISAADLFSWTRDVPTASNVGFYAAQVRSGALERGLRMVAARIEEGVAEMEPDAVISRANDDLRELREDHIIDELGTVTLEHVMQETDVEYDWVIEGLLERRDRMMLTGGEGAGKSTFIRQMAITAASGIHPFREYPIPPSRVLVVDAENTEKQWGREVRKWANAAGQVGLDSPSGNMQLACVRRLDLTKDMDLGQVHRLIDVHKPDILFIGPLYRLISRAINNDDDATPLLAALDTLRDRGLAIVIEAHAGHATNPKGERDLRPRGSSALLGWPEFGYGLKRNAKNAMHVDMVKWRGDRDARAWPTKLGKGTNQRWPWRPVDM
jgi:replicative DNA helicase